MSNISPSCLKRPIAAALMLCGLSNMAGATEGFMIEEIIVTAQKKAENLQDVAVSISTLSAQELENLKLRNSMEIASQVPNMQIYGAYGDALPSITMRGVSQGDFQLNQNSPVAIHMDEVYKGAMALSGMQLFDLDRLEVLRGPQGTLYGKNTTGGAVNFHSKKPSFEQGGYLTAGFGNYQRRELKGAYELPLVDEVLAARAAFIVNRADGYIKNKNPASNDAFAVDEWSARLSLRYTPLDSVDATLRLHKGESDPHTFVGQPRVIDPALGIDSTGYDRGHLDDLETEANLVDKRKLHNQGANLNIIWDINDQHTLTSITSYDKGEHVSSEDTDGTPIRILEFNFGSEVRQVTQELRVTSNYPGAFNWIGGLYYAREKNHANTKVMWRYDAPFNPLLFSGVEGGNDYVQIRDSAAAFAHTTYDITEDLTLTFGLRYTRDDSEMTDFQSFFGRPELGVLTNPIPLLPDIKREDRNWSGKIGLDYHITDAVMVYGHYSEGYRNGAFNGGALFDTVELSQVAPEELEAYEVGFKSRFLDDHYQLNGALFDYEYVNQQLITRVANTPLSRLANIGKSSIQGMELELVAHPIEPLSISAGVGFLDAEYDELVLNGNDLSGNEIQRSPKLNFNLSVDFLLPPLAIGSLSLHFDTAYTGDYHEDPENDAQTEIDSHWVSNGRLTFDSAGGSYSLALWIKNIEDKRYASGIADLKRYNMYLHTLGAPRTFGAEVTMDF